MQRLTIPLHDFVAALRRAIADKDSVYTNHLIHDFVFCDENACAKLDRLPAPAETFSSPYIRTNAWQQAFVHHTSPRVYFLQHNIACDEQTNRLIAAVWEK